MLYFTSLQEAFLARSEAHFLKASISSFMSLEMGTVFSRDKRISFVVISLLLSLNASYNADSIEDSISAPV